ncbi:MAG: response regulator transcription factor [Gemmatimonadetes bacterium]|nr:response regulator transcription factor [Gemmatimonadota bacterium]
MARLLLVEDNADLAFGLRTVLEFEGHEVEIAEDGDRGLERAREYAPDLVILDLMLPGKGGYEVLRELRGAGVRTPVLILTARSQESDVVMGFDLGADDYVTKPFSTLELVARVRALLRRARQDQAGGRTSQRLERFGEVEVNPATRTVLKGGEAVELTPKEFDLLMALLLRRGAVASRTELLSEVWQYGNAEIMTRTVDVHIAELRRKLEPDPANPRHILTARKAGYRLEP